MIEEDIRDLQRNVDDLRRMVINLVHAIRPGHTSDCIVSKHKEYLSNKIFTEAQEMYCYCSNKKSTTPSAYLVLPAN